MRNVVLIALLCVSCGKQTGVIPAEITGETTARFDAQQTLDPLIGMDAHNFKDVFGDNCSTRVIDGVIYFEYIYFIDIEIREKCLSSPKLSCDIRKGHFTVRVAISSDNQVAGYSFH